MIQQKSKVIYRIIPFATHFRAVQPLPRRGIAIRNYNAMTGNGEILINIRKTLISNAENVAVAIGPLAATLTLPAAWADVPAGNQTTLTGTTFSRTSSVTGIPAVAPRDNNYKILIAAYDNTGARIETETFGFVAIPPQTTVRVNATSSLFLAYTAFGVATPNGEVLPDSAPCAVIAPIDAEQVSVTVPLKNLADQTWRFNNSSDPTTANGLFGDPGFENPNFTDDAYISAALGSESIKKNTVRLNHNALVGMWDFGPENASSASACQETMVGLSFLNQGIPEISVSSSEVLKPINLLLGSHASSSWANNLDALEVTITWTVGLI